MNYRYLKINGSIVWGTNSLKRDDLIRCKEGYYDVIIDMVDNTQFDPEKNAWVAIEGDA